MDALTIRRAAPTEPAVRTVLAAHHALMRGQSPAESCHVLDASELDAAGARLFAAFAGNEVLGVGALAQIAPGEAELKSMHVVAAARGRGVGRMMLDRLVQEAAGMGMRQLWLETGSAAAFAAARRLYASAGFTECPPFGTYWADPLSVFMTARLQPGPGAGYLAAAVP